MEFTPLMLDAYSRLHSSFDTELDQEVAQYLRHEDTDSVQSVHPHDFMYKIQESDFTREIINDYNKYAYRLNRLSLWEKVIENYFSGNENEIQYEFTDILFDYCLGAPYEFKSRVIFCASHLCYANGLLIKKITRDDIVADDQININSLKKLAALWERGPALVEALEAIDSKQHRDATGNYRNRSQHQFPPRLITGHIANIQRTFGERGFSVSFGQVPPLQTQDLLPFLTAQAELMQKGYWAYWNLVQEHYGLA